jgi:multiple sugar transport system permease protein
VLPGVVNAILWRFMYDPQLGLINANFDRDAGSRMTK